MRSDIAPGATFPAKEHQQHDVSAFHGWNRWSTERVAAERERLAIRQPAGR